MTDEQRMEHVDWLEMNVGAFQQHSAAFRLELPVYFCAVANDFTLQGDGEVDPETWYVESL